GLQSPRGSAVLRRSRRIQTPSARYIAPAVRDRQGYAASSEAYGGVPRGIPTGYGHQPMPVWLRVRDRQSLSMYFTPAQTLRSKALRPITRPGGSTSYRGNRDISAPCGQKLSRVISTGCSTCYSSCRAGTAQVRTLWDKTLPSSAARAVY